MARKIIDTPYNVEKIAGTLASTGIEYVIRYYNRQNTSRFPDKRLTREEAIAICESGMSLVAVFQQNHRELSDFTTDKARSDAAAAIEIASKRIEQPEGSAIYFSVDHDFYKSSELKVIRDYFRTVKAAFAASDSRYKIGVYGSGTIATVLLDDETVDFVWIARATGWSGTRAFLKTDRWDLYQDAIDIKYGAIDYDTNITGPGVSDFGQFRVETPSETTVAVNVTSSAINPTLFEVASRTTLNLRGGPGLEFGIIRSLAFGHQVYGIKRVGEWVQVDVEGDGLADGFVSSDYLRPLTGVIASLPASGKQPLDYAYQELELQVKEVPGSKVNPRIALYYKALDGESASPNDDDVPWCSYFTNYCFYKAGRKGSGSALARSWLKWGSAVKGEPETGDIIVFWRESPKSYKGHVGFFVGKSGKDVLILGGNQSNAVSIKAMDASQVIGIRRG